MPCATRGNYTRPDVYGILSGECRCLCAARPTVATVVRRARGGRVENVSARGRPIRHQRRPRAFVPGLHARSMAVSWRVAWKSAEARAQAWTKVRGERAFQV